MPLRTSDGRRAANLLTAADTIDGYGTILGTGDLGVALQGSGPVVSAWTFFNRGTVTSDTAAGVDLTAGGLVINGLSGSTSGFISGSPTSSSSGHYGVRIRGANGTVVNYGTIVGGSRGVDLRGGTSNT